MGNSSRIFLLFAFLFVILCSAILPVLSLQYNSTGISSYGTVNYSGLQNTNLAPMPYGWDQWGGDTIPRYLFVDTGVTHDGHASLRMEADYDTTGSGRDAFPKPPNDWIPIKPGDRIVFKCWMKLNAGDGSDNKPYDGARLGIDFYDNTGWIGCTSALNGNPYPYQTDEETIAMYANWGTTTWTLRTMDFYVQNTYTGGPRGAQVPTGMMPWIQVLPMRDTGYAWFADAELYVNPVGM